MNINLYEDYKIKFTGEYNRLSEENETIYDNIFVEDKIDKELILNGGKLLSLIADKLNENYISEFVVVGNEIHFELFNYNNGESASICYEIKVKENKYDNSNNA